jgi:large subunit ribosomal protein L4
VAAVDLRDQGGKKAGSRELPAELFEAPINVGLMHQVVVAGLAAIRRGTHSTKTRGEVRGGGKKPWRQKGTGRARHGSIRSPIWMGGGVAHGPKPRDYSMRVNKKMKRAALRGALTDAAQSGKLVGVSSLSFDGPSTKDAVAALDALEINDGRKTLVVLHEPNRETELSYRNVPHVKVTYARSLSTYDIVAADHVLFTSAALDVLEGKQPTEPPPPAEASEGSQKDSAAPAAGGSAEDAEASEDAAKRPPADGDDEAPEDEQEEEDES